jgi:pyruvate formate lyase activating enzyme
LREAEHFESLADEKVRCLLCPHFCTIRKGKAGRCRWRRNTGGVLYEANYEECIFLGVEAVERKPLYHFFPGKVLLSVGGNGTNLVERFRRDYDGMDDLPSRWIEPKELVDMAHARETAGLSYDRGEPLVWYGFVLDTGREARENGFANVLATRGFINPAPLEALLPLLDAVSLDLRGTSGKLSREHLGVKVTPILRTAKRLRDTVHLEITHRILSGENDDEKQLRKVSAWIAGELGPEVPIHLVPYVPANPAGKDITPVSVLLKAFDIFRSRSHYVYIQSVYHLEGNNTHCRHCGSMLIDRLGQKVRPTGLTPDGRCRLCKGENNIRLS